MKILIIGGTRFVGRHLVEAALARGHELTLFHRGEHGSELFPQVERTHGDRSFDLFALSGRQWDAVIDTCGYFPRIVHMSTEALSYSVSHYTFISTISVYADPTAVHYTEDAPLSREVDPSIETMTNETYGPLKVACERVVQEVLPNRNLIVRPGYIVGPHDRTDRFTYWPWRVAQGGEMLAPGQPDQPVQFIDMRDLAEWTIKMVETKQNGIYQTTGPRDRLSMGTFLETCRQATGSSARFTWVEEQFLRESGIMPEADLPIWLSAREANLLTADCSKAIKAGLTYRPLADTIRDTLAWAASRPQDYKLQAGMKLAERERELLMAWHAERGTYAA